MGLKSKEAAVLAFLMRNYDHPVTQFEIERALELRQPYVSAALKSLESNDWLHVSMRIKHDLHEMGRPPNTYELIATPEEIAQDLRDNHLDRSETFKRSMKVISKSTSI